MRNEQDPWAQIMLEIRLNEVEGDQASREAYEAVYSQTELWQSDPFYSWLYSQLELHAGDRYLDISCGRGELVQRAQKQGIQATGLDLSHNVLKLGRGQLGVRSLVDGNAQLLPYASNTFDVVSNIGSLEHYVNMAWAVREMVRVLKPEGRALILLPNTFSLLPNIWTALRDGRTSIDPYQPIQRYGARREWQSLLQRNGLNVNKTKKYERVPPRTWADFTALLRHPKELAHVLAAPFIPLNLAFCFIFVCTPDSDHCRS